MVRLIAFLTVLGFALWWLFGVIFLKNPYMPQSGTQAFLTAAGFGLVFWIILFLVIGFLIAVLLGRIFLGKSGKISKVLVGIENKVGRFR